MDEGRNAFRGAGLEEAVLEFPPCIRRPMRELAAQNPSLQITLGRGLRDGGSGGAQKLTDARGLGFGSYLAPREASRMGVGDMTHCNVIYLHPRNKQHEWVPGMSGIDQLRRIHTVN